MSDIIELIIDGERVKASQGDTILEAAMKNGIEIPNLCYSKKVTHTASCRLCMVKMKGKTATLPSCTVYAEDGMDFSAGDEVITPLKVIDTYSGKTYYWKVKTFDQKGNSSISEVFEFKTNKN